MTSTISVPLLLDHTALLGAATLQLLPQFKNAKVLKVFQNPENGASVGLAETESLERFQFVTLQESVPNPFADATTTAATIADAVDATMDTAKNGHAKMETLDEQRNLKRTVQKPSSGMLRVSAAGRIFLLYGEEIVYEFAKQFSEIENFKKQKNLIMQKVYAELYLFYDELEHGLKTCNCSEHKFASFASSKCLSLQLPIEGRIEMLQTWIQKRVRYVLLETLPALLTFEESITHNSDSKFPQYIFLKRFVDWKKLIHEYEEAHNLEGFYKWTVVKDERTGEWRATAVADKSNAFESRQLMHPDLRGLRADELNELVNVTDSGFVHHSGFTGGAQSRETMLKMLCYGR